MGRGLSKLQKQILDEASKHEWVSIHGLYELFCPHPTPETIVQKMLEEKLIDGPQLPDVMHTVKTLFRLRKTRPDQAADYWRLFKDQKLYAGLTEALTAAEDAERKRPSMEAAISRAISRLCERGLLERRRGFLQNQKTGKQIGRSYAVVGLQKSA